MPDPAQTFHDQLMSLPGQKVSPDQLEQAGQQAAQLMLQGGTSLNEAVPQVIKDLGVGVNPQQVSRIIEFANQSAHIGQLDASQDYPTFEVADPHTIHNDLRSAATPVESETEGDYNTVPTEDPAPELPAYEGEQSEHSKAAGVFALRGLDTAHVGLIGAKEHAQSKLATLRNQHEMAEADFHKQAKLYLLENGTLGEILQAVAPLGGGEFAKTATGNLGEWLVSQVHPSILRASLEKTGSQRVVNPDHPLIQSYAATVKLARDVYEAEAYVTNLESQAKRINDHLLEAARV